MVQGTRAGLEKLGSGGLGIGDRGLGRVRVSGAGLWCSAPRLGFTPQVAAAVQGAGSRERQAGPGHSGLGWPLEGPDIKTPCNPWPRPHWPRSHSALGQRCSCSRLRVRSGVREAGSPLARAPVSPLSRCPPFGPCARLMAGVDIWGLSWWVGGSGLPRVKDCLPVGGLCMWLLKGSHLCD